MVLVYVFGELKGWINWVILVNVVGVLMFVWMIELLQIGGWLDQNWCQYIGYLGGISEIVQVVLGLNIGMIYCGVLIVGLLVFYLFLMLLFMLIMLFVMYCDGDWIVVQFDRVGVGILFDCWDWLLCVVFVMISFIVIGMMLIVIGEGFILGIVYWLVGVFLFVIFGVLIGFMVLIFGGVFLFFMLVLVYLVVSGLFFVGLVLFFWGLIELFIVDKIICLLLVGGLVKLLFLFIFFGLVGGVKIMGIVGLFVGLVLMVLLVLIWCEWQCEIFEDEVKCVVFLVRLD